MTMADTVAVMHAGRIEQLGPPAQMYEFPATAFVANFLGQSNLIAGEVTGRSGDDVTVSAYGSRFTVPAARSRSVDGPVHLGVRPEKLALARAADGVPAGAQSVAGVVTDLAYLGVSTQYQVRTGWGTELSVFSPNNGPGPGSGSGTGDGALLPLGADVVAYWQPAHAFLLARDPGAGDQTAPLLDEAVPAS